MPKPHLIVCERTPRWAAAWRRMLGPQASVGEVRSLTQLDQLLGNDPTPIAVDASEFSGKSLLPAVARWSQAGSPVVIVGSSGRLEDEFAYREAGAVHVLCSPRQIRSAAEILTRYRASTPTAKPAELPLEEAVYERLPWQRFRKNRQPPGQDS